MQLIDYEFKTSKLHSWDFYHLEEKAFAADSAGNLMARSEETMMWGNIRRGGDPRCVTFNRGPAS
jgi:hypothetical protein